MVKIRSYRDLEVWQVAMDLVEVVYRLTKTFPSDEKFGLTSQIRRAAVSIPSNIAEGWGRTHIKEYLHYLSIAKGSLMEVETQLTIAVRLEFLEREEAKEAWNPAQSVGKMLTRLIQSLQNPKSAPQSPKPETQPPKK